MESCSGCSQLLRERVRSSGISGPTTTWWIRMPRGFLRHQSWRNFEDSFLCIIKSNQFSPSPPQRIGKDMSYPTRILGCWRNSWQKPFHFFQCNLCFWFCFWHWGLDGRCLTPKTHPVIPFSMLHTVLNISATLCSFSWKILCEVCYYCLNSGIWHLAQFFLTIMSSYALNLSWDRTHLHTFTDVESLGFGFLPLVTLWPHFAFVNWIHPRIFWCCSKNDPSWLGAAWLSGLLPYFRVGGGTFLILYFYKYRFCEYHGTKPQFCLGHISPKK